MGKANHKLVRDRMNEKRSKITDKQFFTSRLLAGHFEDIADAQTKRYHYNRRVHVHLYWDEKDSNVAWTDNFCISINAGCEMVTSVEGRANRYQIVCGLFAHELGHVLYTDFLINQTHINNFTLKKWYPVKPILRNTKEELDEAEIWDYVSADEKNMVVLLRTIAQINNVLEDGYVENRVLKKFPGTLGFGLETLRRLHFSKMDTLTRLKERETDNELHVFQTIMQIMLSYVKFGEIKYGDEPLSDERVQAVFDLLTVLDKGLYATDARERWMSVNTALVRLWPYVKDFCEYCKQRNEESLASGGSGEISEILSKIFGSMAGGSTIGEGSTSAVSTPAGEESEEDAESKAKRAKTHASAEKESEDDEDETESDCGINADLGVPEGEPSESEGDKERKDVSAEEGGRIPYHETDKVSNPEGGTFERDDAYERDCYENAASDIERLLETMAERAACKELEDERRDELNSFAKNISYGNIHTGVNMRVRRIASVDEKLVEQYNAIAGKLLTISKQLQKSIARQLQDMRQGAKQTNLLFGRRLNASALHRNDGRVFYKNKLPNETELAVGLLVDESGSMSCRDRATSARATAIIMHDFCTALGIPVMIYGHSTDYPSGKHVVELYAYAEFETFDKNDRYRLMDIKARSNNRDGAALRYVAERLSNRPEKTKLLILISDGQPADYNYDGSAAEEELRGIKQEYQRKGITFVAAAIGEDKDCIERIYGDSFLDITDLNQLPTKLTSVVKRHIRV